MSLLNDKKYHSAQVAIDNRKALSDFLVACRLTVIGVHAFDVNMQLGTAYDGSIVSM